ncbi:MAG: beta-phosphoglucomutase [Saprospiraceae bacterium]|nr:beta-phosphoglucomutase [Saprospiraceae bacterium]
MIKACIFDLDGVIVDTAKYHFLAWRRLANELGFDFTEADNEKLKGVSRMGSLDLILQWGGLDLSEAEKLELADRKNDWYKEYLKDMSSDDILEGVMSFLQELKKRGIRIGLGSASKNAMMVVERIGLQDTFEVIIDGNKATKSKPDPQVFALGAEALGVAPEESIVFEDAESGIQAALNGGFYAVGIGSPENLGHAHLVIPNFIGKSFDDIVESISNELILQK